MKIINNEKKRNDRIYRIHDEIKFYNKEEVSHICKKQFCTDKHDENYEHKKSLRIIVIARENLEELLIGNAI